MSFLPNHVYHSSSTLPAPTSATSIVPATDPVILTSEKAVKAPSHPVPKPRRVQRTEDERIEYLRAHPYVAKFEAYRVLCALCGKWIKLRRNSTYCSIPWDAHHKSCSAKKMCVYAP